MDKMQHDLDEFKEEFFPIISKLSTEEVSDFLGFTKWFVRRYCLGYQLEGPIHLVLDNSIIQNFKNRHKKEEWLRAVSYVALCRFVEIFSDRETCLCISPVSVYECAGKTVPESEDAARGVIAEIFGILAPCRLKISTVGFDSRPTLLQVLEDIHHDAEFMSVFAAQINTMDLRYDLRTPYGGVRIPLSIADDLIPDDMPLRYFSPWYVKEVFKSRIEHKIAEQSKQHPEAQPILSGELSKLFAELNKLKRGVLRGIGDIDLIQLCDIHRQYSERPGFVLLGQTLDATLAGVLSKRHVYSETRTIVGGSRNVDKQIKDALTLMFSRPFSEQDERAERINPGAAHFLGELFDLCSEARYASPQR